jgi:acyl-CoA synthetase (AMP-forming)/AMP-acid ligase II
MRLFDHLDWHARERPDSAFAWFNGREISYRAARERTNQIAHALLSEGLAPGARVAFLAKNTPEFVLFYYGAAKAGVVPVPLNYRLAPPEWSYIVNDSGAQLLSRGRCPPRSPDPQRAAQGEEMAAIDAPPPAGWESTRPGWEPAITPPALIVDENADVYQMYTSGTTGRPRAPCCNTAR